MLKYKALTFMNFLIFAKMKENENLFREFSFFPIFLLVFSPFLNNSFSGLGSVVVFVVVVITSINIIPFNHTHTPPRI